MQVATAHPPKQTRALLFDEQANGGRYAVLSVQGVEIGPTKVGLIGGRAVGSIDAGGFLIGSPDGVTSFSPEGRQRDHWPLAIDAVRIDGISVHVLSATGFQTSREHGGFRQVLRWPGADGVMIRGNGDYMVAIGKKQKGGVRGHLFVTRLERTTRIGNWALPPPTGGRYVDAVLHIPDPAYSDGELVLVGSGEGAGNSIVRIPFEQGVLKGTVIEKHEFIGMPPLFALAAIPGTDSLAIAAGERGLWILPRTFEAETEPLEIEGEVRDVVTVGDEVWALTEESNVVRYRAAGSDLEALGTIELPGLWTRFAR